MLGAVQAVYRRYAEDEPDYQAIAAADAGRRAGCAGTDLFAPPNVKGWPGGKAWLNTATLLERANFAESLAMGTLWANRSPEPAASSSGRLIHVAAIRQHDQLRRSCRSSSPKSRLRRGRSTPRGSWRKSSVSRPEDVVRALLDLYLPGGIASETRAKLVAFVGARLAHGASARPPGARGRSRDPVTWRNISCAECHSDAHFRRLDHVQSTRIF